MFNKCKVCSSDSCDAVNLALAAGCSAAMASRKYSLPVDSVLRHKRNHLPPELIRKARRKQLIGESKFNLEELREHESENLLARLVRQRVSLLALIEKMGETDPRGAVQGHKALLFNLEVEGKLLGEIGRVAPATINQNLIVSADYLKLRQLLLSALRPFPQARAAVLAALRSVESVSDPDATKQITDDPTIATGNRPECNEGGVLETESVASVESPAALAVEEGFAWSEIPAADEPVTTGTSMIVRA